MGAINSYTGSFGKMIHGGRMDDVWESIKSKYRHLEDVI
jgi:hypothetical protein